MGLSKLTHPNIHSNNNKLLLCDWLKKFTTITCNQSEQMCFLTTVTKLGIKAPTLSSQNQKE
jgi:hypothetical protein